MRRDDVRIAATVAGMVFMLFLMTAFVVSLTHHALDKETGEQGSIYYGFYDYGNGWYGTPVIVSFLVLFSVTGIMLPFRKR